MTKVRCDSTNCIYNECHYCTSKEIEVVQANIFPLGESVYGFNRCVTYEKRTDFVEFMEERGFG